MSDDTMTDDRLLARARDWAAGDPDPATRAELEALIDAGDPEALRDPVEGGLEFGTAGLRGVVGAGPNRMNRAVVIRTTRGLADYLLDRVHDAAARGVIVGFDGRHDSEVFARDAVGVLAAAGIAVRWFPTPQPTPMIAYAQKALGAAAAIVITASHNPPEYNGYKVYAEGAAQIVPPTDTAIAAAIERVGPASEVPVDDPVGSPLVATVDAEVVDRYFDELRHARPEVSGPDQTIVYTALHGVATPLIERALAEGGYHDVHSVPSQAEPDGDFPTVRFPNPEEPGALDEALALAAEVDADLILANDPDGDRLAAAVPDPAGGYRLLTGNQIGILLADHLLAGAQADRPLVVSSIVSTPMLHAVAAEYGARSEVTLTGFKWICAAARAVEAEDKRVFIFGFEEALGSSVGTVVRDKDGIGAAVAFADLARSLAADGQTVLDRWAELCQRHGLWISHQHSVTLPGAAGQQVIAAAMERVASDVPTSLAGYQVEDHLDFRHGVDQRPAWLGHHDLVSLDLSDGRVMIRPSGTEPKCKIYVDLRGELAPGDDLDARTRELIADAEHVAAALAAHVGFDAA